MAGIAVGVTVIVGLVALMLKSEERKIKQTIARHYDVGDAQFGRAMGVLLGPANIEGNRIEVLLNGDEKFPAMLSAIRGARKTMTFERYIYWSGSIGREFAEALAERARAGVKVHLLLDWLGSSKFDAAEVGALESAGVMVRKFHEPAWYHLTRMNNRTHRKALVIDGHVGFTGGVGIADA